MQPLRTYADIQKYGQEKKTSLGYHINDDQTEEKKALLQAFDLVTKAREKGLEIREWAKQAAVESLALLTRLKQQPTLAVEMKLWELTCWENKILMVLKKYMNETADLNTRIKSLNPPLKSEQIKTFIDAMMADRNTTVDAMEPLTQTMASITSFRQEITHKDPGAFFDYRPG